MAQQGNRRKQAPAYSADTMALRYIAGLALAALGVMIFMAVDLNMSGNIFQGLRQVCFGVSGSMAYLLAALPLWAGVLVVWSTQRRAPVKPWIFALLSFVCVSAFLVLISKVGNQSFLDYLTNRGRLGWGNAITTGYSTCESKMTSGGALGVIFAWPLWSLSPALGIALYLLAALFCLLMIFNLTPRRIVDLFTGKESERKQQREAERAYAEQQQQMELQQQQAMQQQQAWIMEQQYRQQQQQAQQQYPQQYPGQQYPQQQQQYPSQYPQQQYPQQAMDPAQNSVEQWQMSAQQPAAETQGTHKSRIFGPRAGKEENKQPRSWKSRIFRKKEEEYDGLVGEEEAQQPVQQPRKPTRRTATGAPIEGPETRWNLPDEQAQQPVRPAQRPGKPAQPVREEPEEETAPRMPVTKNPDAYRRPEQQKPQETAERPEGRRRQPVRQPEEEPELPQETERPANRRRTAAPQTGRPAVPVVQQEIGREAYTPELKLQPSDKPPRQHVEEEWFPVPYNYPPITDLAMPQPKTEDTAGEDAMRSRKLEETLASFRVQARVVHVTHGPAISRFELELASGTKVNKVAELEKDIAYGMEATSIRIEAPIPGKSLVGVEVPNRKVDTVTLREVLQSEKMQSAKSLLTVALGKDLTGTPIVCDLAKMPHMLIAGQTGSGKSVCINAIINSLLYRASPDEVKLILVDPKVVELQCYNGIPHLLLPVVNDPRKAAAALAWAVAEMMERYDRFAERKVRNVDGYNASLKSTERPMSRIVIIIDELADLMMVCKKDVEEYICRLTQLARAAGIHLIVATQRPSVDVITGLIKANIPSRIAFKTASSVDSRTILDRNGSEQLLGWGDMLYLPTGSFAPTRVQGCFLSDDEVNRIVKHVKDANPSTYDPNILERVEQLASGGETEGTGADLVGAELGGGDGSLFEQAVEFAIADGQISTSTLQRRLKIGYARAGRLTDEMEERGIVAAKDGSKPRKCLITKEEWEEIKRSSQT